MTWTKISILAVVLIFCLSLAGYSWRALHGPVAPIAVTDLRALQAIAPSTVDLPWPAYGGSALSIDGGAINLQYGSTKQSPTASTAKVMTALAVLDKKPIAPGADGQSYVVTAEDVTIYNNYVAKNGSVAAVQAGTTLTERQMLQALMLPSANNIADTLVNWTFGSMADYVTFANRKAAELGMKDSYFADASGFSPATLSTPADLVKLGNAAVANGALMEIASQKSAVIPVAGTITNVNSLLGQDGIIGLKTGNTDEAGGCFMMAGRITPQGSTKPVTVVTAIMAAPSRAAALRDSLPFMKAVAANFETVTVVEKSEAITRMTAPWGGEATGRSEAAISLLRWKGENIKPTFKNDGVSGGTISVKGIFDSGKTSVKLDKTLGSPSVWWRLTHP